jgi:hypothetical protein
VQLGVSLNADGALGMMPGASVGGSVSVWFLSADREMFTTFGVGAWPTHRREDAEISRYADYERPLWVLSVQQTQFIVDIDPLHLGLFGGLHMGTRRSNDGMSNEFTYSFSVGAALRYGLGEGPFALRLELGVAPPWNGRKTAAVASLALDLAFN